MLVRMCECWRVSSSLQMSARDRRPCRWNGGCLLVYFTLLTMVIGRSWADPIKCSESRDAFTSKGLAINELPQHAISAQHLEVCGSGGGGTGSKTCCTPELESQLSEQSRREYEEEVEEAIGQLRSTFASRTSKFNDFFTELLENSQRDLNTMFLKTYGMLYEQNAQVFTELYTDLDAYYKGGNLDLMDALDNFFTKLFQRMFQLLNAQYSFEDRYLGCVSEYMEELKPFGDVPQKLNVQVKRAFVAARTFVQALAIGRDVVGNVIEVQSSPTCRKSVTKLSYCAHCQGLPHLKPCRNYCLNVLKGCLAHHAELDPEWNKYIEALLQLADRLQGPFNIEQVVDPIDVKISDAIMNFQESGPAVSEKVFAGCGKPRLGKREAPPNPPKKQDGGDQHDGGNKKEIPPFETIKFGRTRGGGRKNGGMAGELAEPQPTTAAGTNLDRLVRDIRGKMQAVRGFWTSLPHDMCGANGKMASEPSSDDGTNCWNGNAKAKYLAQLVGDGVVNQANNPEVKLDISKENSVISKQVMQLRLVTTKLNNAYNGKDVAWIDSADIEDDMEFSSGSGSGSGFDLADITDDTEGDDDDDRDGVSSGWSPERVDPPRRPVTATPDEDGDFMFTTSPPVIDTGREGGDDNNASATISPFLPLLLSLLFFYHKTVS